MTSNDPTLVFACEADIATLWTDAETACVLSWVGDRYRLRLIREGVILKDDFEVDERVLLAVSRWWQREQNGPMTANA